MAELIHLSWTMFSLLQQHNTGSQYAAAIIHSLTGFVFNLYLCKALFLPHCKTLVLFLLNSILLFPVIFSNFISIFFIPILYKSLKDLNSLIPFTSVPNRRHPSSLFRHPDHQWNYWIALNPQPFAIFNWNVLLFW